MFAFVSVNKPYTYFSVHRPKSEPRGNIINKMYNKSKLFN